LPWQKQGWLKGQAMRSIDIRIPLLAGAAIVLLAFSPARAETGAIQFVPGTGDATTAVMPLANDDDSAVLDGDADVQDTQADMLDLSEKLADPRMQDGLAAMIGSISEKMLDLPIGKFAVAMERAVPGGIKGKRGKRIREDDTLADLAGRDAERLPDQIADGSRQMMGMMSGFTAAFATMIPEFEKLGDEIERGFEDAKDASRERQRRRD
jgi:hypothetical protein